MDNNRYIEIECKQCRCRFRTTTRNKLGLCPDHYYIRWKERRNYLDRVRRKYRKAQQSTKRKEFSCA